MQYPHPSNQHNQNKQPHKRNQTQPPLPTLQRKPQGPGPRAAPQHPQHRAKQRERRRLLTRFKVGLWEGGAEELLPLWCGLFWCVNADFKLNYCMLLILYLFWLLHCICFDWFGCASGMVNVHPLFCSLFLVNGNSGTSTVHNLSSYYFCLWKHCMNNLLFLIGVNSN
jgi:hypothetical protein